ncbi:alpha/beta hydrolase [Alcanivorax sp. JB21]|uniref:alpha/beta hydrolase n=1 Tax=Alcanivorax limicola TaxID=2874102 RepID=UPI001CBFCAFE|nr:alpha/beta hydrolase [Alcanivorax limicola]MBZ2190158.1 alpha/beta hydrolase [Alcanivorax limicola]
MTISSPDNSLGNSPDTPDIRFPDMDTSRGQRLLAATLRGSMRVLVKPLFHVLTPLAVQRTGLRLSAASTLSARGVTREAVRVGGVPAERLRPANGAGDKVVLYLHGGAYCVGSPATHRSLTTHLARAANATVLALDYQLAPEAPFPAARDDVLDAYRALLEEGVAPAHIFIAGDSAGGGLTLSVAQTIRDQALPAPAGLIMLSPWVDLTHPRASEPSHPGEVMLSWGALDKAARQYIGTDVSSATEALRAPGVSPLLGSLANLPPTLTITGTDEILLGDSEQLIQALHDAGNQATLLLYRGMWHVFPVHAGMLNAADHAIASMAEFMQ